MNTIDFKVMYVAQITFLLGGAVCKVTLRKTEPSTVSEDLQTIRSWDEVGYFARKRKKERSISNSSLSVKPMFWLFHISQEIILRCTVSCITSAITSFSN